MGVYSKRAMVTLRPEWEPELDRLKKEQFYNKTQAEMFRFLISLGLDALGSSPNDGSQKNQSA